MNGSRPRQIESSKWAGEKGNAAYWYGSKMSTILPNHHHFIEMQTAEHFNAQLNRVNSSVSCVHHSIRVLNTHRKSTETKTGPKPK